MIGIILGVNQSVCCVVCSWRLNQNICVSNVNAEKNSYFLV